MCGVHIVILYHSFLAIILDVLQVLGHNLDAEWRQFGIHLRVEPAILNVISCDNFSVTSRMFQLLDKWLGHEDGTGDLPRAWHTVVQAVKHTGKGLLAEQLAQQLGATIGAMI